MQVLMVNTLSQDTKLIEHDRVGSFMLGRYLHEWIAVFDGTVVHFSASSPTCNEIQSHIQSIVDLKAGEMKCQ